MHYDFHHNTRHFLVIGHFDTFEVYEGHLRLVHGLATAFDAEAWIKHNH